MTCSVGGLVDTRSVPLKNLVLTWSCWSAPGNDSAGLEKENQDAWVVKELFANREGVLLAVFDGHGACGRAVSHAVTSHLPRLLSNDPDFRGRNIAAALATVFPQCNALLERLPDVLTELSGSTGVVAHVSQLGTLSVGSVGDSRCIIGRRRPDGRVTAHQINQEHSPTTPGESERVLAHRGRIAPFSYRGEPLGPPRVWLADRNVPGLCMTRSFGDALAGTVGVTCEPDVQQVKLHPDDIYLIVMSDGIFEFMSNQEIIDIVHELVTEKRMPLNLIARRLVREARNRWKQEEGGDVIDDCTAIVCELSQGIAAKRADDAAGTNANLLDAHAGRYTSPTRRP